MVKKFLFKTSLFVVGRVLIAQLLASVVIHFQPNNKNMVDYQLQINNLLRQASEIEMVTLGSSHNVSIDFDQFNQSGYHLWRPGGDLFEVKYQLESLFPRLANIKVVLISVSYFSFHWDNGIRPEFRRWMYAAIPSWSFIDGEFKHFVLGKMNLIFPYNVLVREDHWNNVFRAIFNRDLRTANFERGKDGQKLRKGYVTCEYHELEELVAKAKDIGVPRHLARQRESLAYNKNLTIDTYQTAVDIIQYLQAREVRVVFYTPPYFETYTELYDADTVQLMKDYMAQLQQDYQIEYYDFSTDPQFVQNYRLFMDHHHLNLCGARLFSSKLQKILSTP